MFPLLGEMQGELTGGRENDNWGLPNQDARAISGALTMTTPCRARACLQTWRECGRTNARGAPNGRIYSNVSTDGGITSDTL